MKRPPVPAQPREFLPVGTVVGPWRVVAWAGSGVYGAVYRAVRVGQEQAEPVALKVGLFPGDPRFAREAELLWRTHHPSIPGLIDAGEWQHPAGTRHPYVAMEWIDGVPLYGWAGEHAPDSRQVLRLLAQLASALQALHAGGGLHRDVKGDNVLVRRADGRAVLMDFGSGIYTGAASLTPQPVPPGTPAYRSPESWLFELRFGRDRTARYRAGPADDLFALGVTACRLVTGEYPEFGEPSKDEDGIWQLGGVIPPAALLEPGVDPRLRALILRMLSERPEERGTAEELAAELERAAGHTSSESAPPVSFAGRIGSRARADAGRPWVALAAGLALAVGVWWSTDRQPEGASVAARGEAVGCGQPDADMVGLGDSSVTASAEDSSEPATSEGMSEDTLPEPQPGQTRPDTRGRCPQKWQASLNGACWVRLTIERDACEALNGQMHKGTCYAPVLPPERQPTSQPAVQP